MMREQPDELIPTRTSLLKRLKDWRDHASWQEFFDNYWKLIYGVARKAGLTDSEAQDVVQETMLSVAKHMPNFTYDPAIGSFKGWLFTMTRWRVIGQLRKRKPLADHRPLSSATATGTDPLQNIADPAGQVLDAIWETEWKKNLLDAAISMVKHRVDPRNYQIFDFYVNKDWSPEKVAARFGVSVGAVYVAKHRVTELIKIEVKRLEKELS
jgi:RNA polymerase sigma-70 factor (ECF subfamily)